MNRNTSGTLWGYGLSIALCLNLMACGKNDPRPSAEITGTVTLDGKPLEEGSIHFASKKTGESADCNLEKGGTYRVSFPAADLNESYEVWIGEADVNPKGTPAHEMKEAPEWTVEIPRKYFSRIESGLTTKITKPGENQADFSLTSQ